MTKEQICDIFNKIHDACFLNNKFGNAVEVAIPLLKKGNVQLMDTKIEILRKCAIFIQNFKAKDMPVEEMLEICTCDFFLYEENKRNYLYVDLALFDAIRMIALNHVNDTDSKHILPLCHAKELLMELKRNCCIAALAVHTLQSDKE